MNRGKIVFVVGKQGAGKSLAAKSALWDCEHIHAESARVNDPRLVVVDEFSWTCQTAKGEIAHAMKRSRDGKDTLYISNGDPLLFEAIKKKYRDSQFIYIINA